MNTPPVTETMRIKVLERALRDAEVWFADYERQHLAKGTPDADAKAKVNAERAQACRLALLHSTPVAGGEGSAEEWTFDRDKYAAEIKEFLDEHFAGSSGSDRASHPARIDGAPREAIAKLEEALRPFALMADRFIYLDDEQLVHLHTSKGAANPMVPNTVGDFRRAQAALLSGASEESQDGTTAKPPGTPQSEQPGIDAAPSVRPAEAAPIPMILHCPKCGLQHVDAPEMIDGEHPVTGGDVQMTTWTNPPHKSHLCHGCGFIWRPADVPTEGVAAITTRGKNDSDAGFKSPPREGCCDDCLGHNPVWFAPNDLWNLVVGGPEAKGDPGGFLCPVCFTRRAEAAGIKPTAWVLTPEGREMIAAAPSGGSYSQDGLDRDEHKEAPCAQEKAEGEP